MRGLRRTLHRRVRRQRHCAGTRQHTSFDSAHSSVPPSTYTIGGAKARHRHIARPYPPPSRQGLDYPTANLSTQWVNSDASLLHNVRYVGGFVLRPILLCSQSTSFATGFFCAPPCDMFYFGVFIVQTDASNNIVEGNPQVVWSANRAHPLRENATVELTLDGELVLCDADGSLVWSTGSSGRMVAGMVITNIGNLVLFDLMKATIWQSFDHPTDALVPGQSLVDGMRLTASTSDTNWTETQLYVTVHPDGLYACIASAPPQLYYAMRSNEEKTGNYTTKVTFMNGSLSIFLEPKNPDSNSISLPTPNTGQHMRLMSDGHLRMYEWHIAEDMWHDVYDVMQPDNGPSASDSTITRLKTKVQLSPSNSAAASAPSANNSKVILGTIIIIVLLAIAVTLYLERRRAYAKKDEELNFGQFARMPTRFPFQKLRECTEGFNKKLGEGGFGSVYEGKLGEERVAVKRLEGARQGMKEFLAEVETIGSIEHINLVRLIGFCAEKSQRLLVYEYMPRGSLDRWIHYRHNNAPLDWCTRCRIILDIAKGMCYLHEGCRRKIAHLDIKPQNILLDENFNAKVADFGLSKLIDRDQSKVMTMMRGTPGYMAPEWLTSQITEKVDVYSFGVVVMELISGRKNIDNSLPEESSHLINLFRGKARDNQLSDLIDKHSQDMLSHQEQVIEMMKLGMWCLLNDGGQRPSMSTVIKVLEGGMSIETTILHRFLNTNTVLPLEDNPTAYSVQPQASVLSGPR
ncbi:hypothetical protein VPH35_012283 [Triticum aestivum]